MLANLLPGLREIRAPVVSGYLWLLFFYLALHEELPTRDSAGQALRPLFDLASEASVVGIATVASVAAYLVGSAMQEVLKLIGRRISPAKPLYGVAGVHLSRTGSYSVLTTLRFRGQEITGKLVQQALSPGERGIDRIPSQEVIERELPLIRTLLLGEKPELVGELDRLQAEADLRITVAVPLACLAIFLGLESSSGWFAALVPAALLLSQGYQRQREAGDFLAQILHIGRADAPALTSFERSVDAALSMIEIEWQLRKEMEDDEDEMAAFRLGNLQASAGEFELAIRSLGFAAKHEVPHAYVELGRAHGQQGDQDRAERAFRDGHERGDRKATEFLVELLVRQDRAEEARELAVRTGLTKEAEDVAPSAEVENARAETLLRSAESGDLRAAINYGLLLKRRGDRHAAVRAFRKATEIDPSDPSGWLELGEAFSEVNDQHSMVEAFDRARQLEESDLGPDHLDVAVTWSRFAGALYEQGEYARSMEAYQRTLEIQEAKLGRDNSEVGRTIANLANVTDDLGDYETARDLYRQALEILERNLAPDDLTLFRIRGNQATSFRRNGEYERARRVHEEVLEAKEASLSPGDISLAITLGNLGVAVNAIGDDEEALKIHQRSLAIVEAGLEPDSLSVGKSLVNLGHSLCRLGRPEQALPLLERGRSLFEEHSPPLPGETAEAGVDLAECYRLMGWLERAEDLQRTSLGVLERERGYDPAALAVCRRQLGAVFNDREAYGDAYAVLSKALATLESRFGVDHIEVARVLAEAGRAELGLARYADAARNLDRALAIARARSMPDNLDLCHFLVIAAQARRQLGEAEVSAQMLDRAVEIARSIGSSIDLAVALRSWAETEKAKGNLEAAAAAIEEAIAAREERPQVRPLDLAADASWGAELLIGLGREEEAMALSELAEKIRKQE